MGTDRAFEQLAFDAVFWRCVGIIREKQFACKGNRTNLEEINEYGAGLSIWFDVYQTSAYNAQTSNAFLGVVNTFLAKWSSNADSETFKGFSYHSDSTCFSINEGEWRGMHEGLRRDFDAARQLFG
jgi:hypothetical protein